MPVSPPYYMGKGRKPDQIKVSEMLDFYADHVLSLFGQEALTKHGKMFVNGELNNGKIKRDTLISETKIEKCLIKLQILMI